jgi:pimeloyl-ACP methyl ester carboxylesterase
MASPNRSRPILLLSLAVGLAAGPLATIGLAGPGSGGTARARPAASRLFGTTTSTPVAGYAPLGLGLIHPYTPGKIPVVLIHGLNASPLSWAPMVAGLEADPVVRDGCQIWTFGYASGDPILYSASLLRQALLDARRQLDPARKDPAFDRMVLVGYSLGGVLAKVMAEDSGSRLWDTISAQPPSRLSGPPPACELIRRCFLFDAVPEVRRIIFIATPHRGSPFDQGAVRGIAARLAWRGGSVQEAHQSLVASNPPGFFVDRFRKGIPTSVDQLTWMNPRLVDLCALPVESRVTYHSIIAEIDDPPRPGGSDGVVPYASAHLDGAQSELLVHSGHLCQANPLVIRECDRIIEEHLASFGDRRAPPPPARSADRARPIIAVESDEAERGPLLPWQPPAPPADRSRPGAHAPAGT